MCPLPPKDSVHEKPQGTADIRHHELNIRAATLEDMDTIAEFIR